MESISTQELSTLYEENGVSETSVQEELIVFIAITNDFVTEFQLKLYYLATIPENLICHLKS